MTTQVRYSVQALDSARRYSVVRKAVDTVRRTPATALTIVALAWFGLIAEHRSPLVRRADSRAALLDVTGPSPDAARRGPR
jgi:hypothetical protein